jgi:hypothetical protein
MYTININVIFSTEIHTQTRDENIKRRRALLGTMKPMLHKILLVTETLIRLQAQSCSQQNKHSYITIILVKVFGSCSESYHLRRHRYT